MVVSDFLLSGLAAFVVAGLVHMGLIGLGKGDTSSADFDKVILAAAATFVTTLVALHQQWLA